MAVDPNAGNGGNVRVPTLDPTAMGLANPFAPPVEPPPSASLGFQAWASDPRNAMKVAHAMTDPYARLQPGAGRQGSSPASGSASQLIDFSALDAYERGPGSVAGGQGAASTPAAPMPAPAAAPSAGATRPAVAPAAAPAIDTSALDAYERQTAADQAEASRLKNTGPGLNQIKNPFLRGLARAGDIAAPFLLGRGAMAIPGTTAHNIYLQREQAGRVGADQDAMQKELQGYLDQANLASSQANVAHTQAETAAIPQQQALKRLQVDQSAAKAGLKTVVDENGNLSFAPDENSPVYQQQQLKNQALDAQAAYAKAGVALRQAQAALAAAKNDPNSAAYKLAKSQQDRLEQMMPILKERADAYMGGYLQRSHNTGLDGEYLPGSPVITDQAGTKTVVGTGNASNAMKAQSNVAMLNEVDTATKGMRAAATALVRSGSRLNDPRVAAAIADPKTTAGQWTQGQFATSGLTPAQRNYVIAVKAYKERLQPLRKSAGGSVSDQQVSQLLQLAPGAQTPDLDYFNRQLDQIDQLRTNLIPGATTVKGGLTVSGRPSGAAQAPGTQRFTDKGVVYHIPANMVQAFRKDHPNAR